MDQVPHINESTQAQIEETLTRALNSSLAFYENFATKKPFLDTRDFSEHYKAAVLALEHLEALVKLAPGVTGETRQSIGRDLEALYAEAEAELAARHAELL